MNKQPAPSLLPVLRSQQQGEILALLLGDPGLELSLSDIAERTGAPHPSVYREIQRAEQAGLVTTRKVGNTRLARANTDSPYYAGLAEVLTRAFGVPAVLAEVLSNLQGITEAYVYGSWAARHEGRTGTRPIGDIDVLVLGDPDRDQLYTALSEAETRLGRPVQATIREPGWLDSGTGAFHDTVTSRPMVKVGLLQASQRVQPSFCGRRRSSRPTPESASVAFSIAHLASAPVIGAALAFQVQVTRAGSVH